MRSNTQLLPVGLFFSFLLLLALSVLILPSLGMNPALGGLAVVGLSVLAPLITRPRLFFWMYFIWAWVLKFFQSFFSLARYGDEVMILVWVLILLGAFAFRKKMKTDKWFIGLFGGLILTCLLSWFANGSNTKKGALFVVSYLVPVFTFYLARNYLDLKRDLRVFIFVVLGLFILQLLLNIGWMFHVNPFPNPWQYTHDFAIGSMYSQTNVAYFCSFLLVALFGAFFHTRMKRRRALIVMFSLLVLFQMIITYTVHVYLVLAVGIGAYILLFSGRKIVVSAPFGLVVGIFAFWLALQLGQNKSFEATQGQNIAEELRIDNLRFRWEKMALGPKGQCYADAFYHAPSEKSIRWFVGAGPGDFISTVAMFQRPYSKLTMRYLGKYYLTYTGAQERAGQSITDVVVAAPSVLMGELGALGLLLYVSLYVCVLWVVMRNISRRRYDCTTQLILAKGLVASSSILLILGLLVDVIAQDGFVILFWTVSALVIEPFKEKVEDQDDKSMLNTL